MNTELPVIFLTFANEQHGGRYLDNVVKEAKALTAILSPVSANVGSRNAEHALCELVVRSNVSLGEIIEVLNAYKDRDLIFHFGGHADGYQLLLEGTDGEAQVAQGEGLVPILSRRKNLKLVFLNGCSTQRLARDLVERGIPAVIGTSASISDKVALLLATRFYKGLASGLTLAGAWEEAKDEARALGKAGTDMRGIKLDTGTADRFPWDVAFRDQAAKEEMERWNLPEAAQNPLMFLPELKPAQLPVDPFLFLKPYEARHAEIFFGRSRYIRDLWLKILEPATPPLILLYGESGAGKSSLLDAGLRPRLEMAVRDDQPDQLLFDVRYARRDQDEGLVGTLARLLELPAGAENEDVPEDSRPVVGPELPPDLEKLAVIEKLAQELEESKTKYTFLSIIDRYRSVQRQPAAVRPVTGLYDGGRLLPDTGARMKKAWQELEAASGCRLIVILDQVEELFTRPHANHTQELADLLQVIREIFRYDDSSQAIRGKLILAYREEYNAKIEARVKEQQLARTTVFLEQLKEKDIHDIFRGLQSGRARQEYNIQVEEKLPGLVANQLLQGNTAVAPVLQLLLTKLWRKAYGENSHAPAFTVEAFQEVQSRGKEMEEYFDSQIKKVRDWNAEVVESGLALDILHFHVSDLGTSNRRHLDTIRLRYQHLETEFGFSEHFTVGLVEKLKDPEIFLLNDLGWGYTGLPHDTLAPIIIREYNRSDKVGQRSARILDTKSPDLIRATQEGDDALKKLCLDENDLEVVQEGQKGMRKLEDRERRLLQISLEEREKRLRLRRILIKGGIAAGLFILMLTIFAASLSVSMTEHVKNGVISRALEASILEQEHNPFRSIQLAQLAYQESNTHPLEVVRNMYALYGRYWDWDPYAPVEEEIPGEEDFGLLATRPDTLAGGINAPASGQFLSRTLKAEAGIRSLSYHPDLGYLCSLNDTTIKYWPKTPGANARVIDIRQDFVDIRDLEFGFSVDGRNIQVVYRSGRDPLYLLNGTLKPPPKLQLFLGTISYEEDYLDQVEPFGYYDFYLGKFVDEIGLTYTRAEFDQCLEDIGYEYGTAIYAASQAGTMEEINVDSLFSFHLLDENRHLFRIRKFDQLLGKNWNVINLPEAADLVSLSGIPLRITNLSNGLDNVCLVWDPEELTDVPKWILVEEEALLYLTSLSGDRFLVVRQNQEVLISDGAGNPVRSLLPAGSGILDIAASPNGQYLFAMTADQRVYLWDLEGNPMGDYRHPDIIHYSFSRDGRRLLTKSADQVRVWFAAAGPEPVTFTRPPDAPPISLARFHFDQQHLIVGLSYSEEPGSWWKRIFGREANSQIAFWDPADQESSFFEGPAGPLLDAAVGQDGHFAVALQENTASILPNPEEKIDNDDYRPAPIEGGEPQAEHQRQQARIFLSPTGKYIVRQFPADSRLELFDLRGRPVNAYNFQNRFRQGFNEQLFAEDDHFLIGSGAKEILFWHPEDDAILTWANDFEMYLEEKQEYDLDTFMDYVPGAVLESKWWAIGVILVTFIFVLLYFSDYAIGFIQSGNYPELFLYSFGFILLSSIFGVLWGFGSANPVIENAVFYAIVFATLIILALALRQSVLRQKTVLGIALGLVALFVLWGSFRFLQYEGRQHQLLFDKLYKRNIQLDYTVRRPLYDSLYRVGLGLEKSEELRRQALKPEQLKNLVSLHQLEVPVPVRSSEWPGLFIGLVVLLVFGSLVVYPLYRATASYRKAGLRLPAFYNWLYLPVTLLTVSLWAFYAVVRPEDFGEGIGKALSLISGFFMLGMVVWQGYRAIRGRTLLRPLVYGIPLLLIGLVLWLEHGHYALAMGLAAAVGWQARKWSNQSKGFAFLSFSIFLGSGAALWAIQSYIWTHFLGIGYGFLLGVIIYQVSRQLRLAKNRKASGMQAWLHYLAVVGLWLLGLAGAIIFSDELYLNANEDYQDAYPVSENYLTDMAPDEEIDPAFDDTEPALPPGEGTEVDSLSEPEGIGEMTAPAPTPTGDTFSVEPTADPPQPELPPRQRLIRELFVSGSSTRLQAQQELESTYLRDPGFIDALVAEGGKHAGTTAGVKEVLYLLEKQSKEKLKEKRETILTYLEGIPAGAFDERIQDLRYLILY